MCSTGGVREAPRHEIAGWRSLTAHLALWGLEACSGASDRAQADNKGSARPRMASGCAVIGLRRAVFDVSIGAPAGIERMGLTPATGQRGGSAAAQSDQTGRQGGPQLCLGDALDGHAHFEGPGLRRRLCVWPDLSAGGPGQGPQTRAETAACPPRGLGCSASRVIMRRSYRGLNI